MGHPPQIPLTPQTDERNFPVWKQNAPPGVSGHSYPKQLTQRFTAEQRDEWREKNRQIDPNTNKEFYNERCPKVGDPVPVLSTMKMVDAGFADNINEPVVVADAEDEELVREMLGLPSIAEAIQILAVPVHNPRVGELEDEVAALKKKLAAHGDKPDTKTPAKKRQRGKVAPKMSKTLSELADAE